MQFDKIIEEVVSTISEHENSLDEEETSQLQCIGKCGEGDRPDVVLGNGHGICSNTGSLAVLGDFLANCSPKQIRLYSEPISVLCRGTVTKIQQYLLLIINAETRKCIYRMIVSKTYFHEQFHFMWDLASNEGWPGAAHSKSTDTEEALATAWGWYCSQAYGRRLGLADDVIEAVTKICFDGIELQGYKNWKNWAHGCFFESEFARYFDLEHSNISPEPDPRDRLNDFFRLVGHRAARINYKILTRKNGEEMASFIGDRGAFPDFVNVNILRKAGTYYPFDSHCDLRKGSVASPNHIYRRFPKSGEVSDLFLCYRKIIPSLEGIHKKLGHANRICLRHSHITGPILGLLKIRKITFENIPIEDTGFADIFIDQPIQKALNKADIPEAICNLMDEGRDDLAGPKI